MYSKVIGKYKELGKPAKASIWFIICNFLQKGISFVTIPIFTRLMTTEEYGLTTLYNTWSSILMIFATLNLSLGAYSRGLVEFEQKKFTSIIQSIATFCGLILFAIVLIFREFFCRITGLNFTILFLMLIYFIFETGLNLWSVKERFNYRYRKLVIVTLLNTILSTVVAIIAVLIFQNKGEAKIISSLITCIVISIPFYVINWKNGKVVYEKKIWKYALAFSLPLVPHYLSNLVLNQSDKIMINMFCGTTYVAFYGVAYSVASILRILLDAVNATLTPWRYQNMDKKNYASINKISTYILALIAGLVVVINLFAPEILSVFASEEYRQAVWVIPPIILSVYYIFLYGLFSSVEFYFLETKFMMVASVASAILNIVLNYCFIKIFGYIACAYTSLICYILYCIFHYVYMKWICRKKIGKQKIYNMKIIIVISLACTICTVISTLMYTNIILRYVSICICLIVAFALRKKIIRLIKEVRK